MPEQKTASLYQQQKAIKPLVEDIIPEHIEGGMKNSALDFIAWLRANKMKPAWTLTNQWKAVYKGRNICRITLSPWNEFKKVMWVVTAYLEHIKEYEDAIINEDLQNFVWDNVIYCVQKPKESFPPVEYRYYALKSPCNTWGCAPGKTGVVCGKELTNICRNSNRQYFWFHDPDDASLNVIKRRLELEQTARTNKSRVTM